MEGSLVRKQYEELARQIGIEWPGRDPHRIDPINQGLNQAHHHLYSITEVAIRTAHLDPAFGFLHRGNGRSFVFDIADLVKLTTTVPLVFRLCREGKGSKRTIRTECRDMFRRENLLDRLIRLSLEVLGC